MSSLLTELKFLRCNFAHQCLTCFCCCLVCLHHHLQNQPTPDKTEPRIILLNLGEQGRWIREEPRAPCCFVGPCLWLGLCQGSAAPLQGAGSAPCETSPHLCTPKELLLLLLRAQLPACSSSPDPCNRSASVECKINPKPPGCSSSWSLMIILCSVCDLNYHWHLHQ